MAWIPGGTFAMGSDRHYPEEAPVREVTVDGFWIDEHPVTNLEFTRFVKDDGPRDARGAGARSRAVPGRAARHALRRVGGLPEVRRAGRPEQPLQLVDVGARRGLAAPAGARTARCTGASGTRSCTSPTSDAEAYAAWAGKELPTEAEWEYAARGGLDGAEFAWGDELTPKGRPMANTWQGEFPYENTLLDGHEGTSPVGSFPPNGYGLVDITGNVWEWTTDWYTTGHNGASPCCGGDPRAASVDPNDPAAIPRRVMKGGSHLCAPNYCRRYRPAARMAQAIDTSTNHLGFRCIVRA